MARLDVEEAQVEASRRLVEPSKALEWLRDLPREGRKPRFTMRSRRRIDWSLIPGRRHLDRTLRTYAEHYNRGRPHRALVLATPLAEPQDPVAVSPRDVRRRDLLGGLIHEYHGAAA